MIVARFLLFSCQVKKRQPWLLLRHELFAEAGSVSLGLRRYILGTAPLAPNLLRNANLTNTLTNSGSYVDQLMR